MTVKILGTQEDLDLGDMNMRLLSPKRWFWYISEYGVDDVGCADLYDKALIHRVPTSGDDGYAVKMADESGQRWEWVTRAQLSLAEELP